MDTALIIGGTRFIGRHTVREFRDHGYDVAIFNRGRHDNPFITEDVVHVTGDRTDQDALDRARRQIKPDVVVDCAAYHPENVRSATEIFANTDAYVYVSSGAAYGEEVIPKREDETPLCACTPEQATDDSWETYGPRKAQGDRAVFAAGDRGVRAMSVRPPIVYGPYDYTNRFAYWIDRVQAYDRIVVPYTALRHLVYVGDVASAIRAIAERGDAGTAYNVGTHTLPVLTEWIELIADTLGTSVESVEVSERELATVSLEPSDFPLYREYPHVLDTHKLESIGWEATPIPKTVTTTVDRVVATAQTIDQGPDRTQERRVLETVSS
ncbi:NAD-dependent epimerase/dehydratase family protein [Halocatena pleomorpha]|uniref:NAD-dependent epimerase/dehydratase family protein n=1 Tax=Halocatena pleomorpha TaxID=1785090 RepID=A0A3P3RGI4_9EURY|nr:NAD-dependent epimerase/dehydratase family protein [Halocatena pleomorpha]RRJ32475.1 NAD-dependent epimerase/dehydratase family protein [Halocatena pleomorpha]